MSEKIERFEDFVAWQKARVLTKVVYKISGSGDFYRDIGLRDQMRRASVSMMANIAEGFERGRPAEFHQFLSMAKSSCAELRSHLYVALDAGYIDVEVFETTLRQAEEVGRVIGGLRLSAENRREAHHCSSATSQGRQAR
jgi:four helix bundle protein